MIYTKHLDQRDDGGFDCYVVVGNVAPWDAPDEVCVKFATEQDADKLIALLADTSVPALDVFRIAGGDVECLPSPSAAEALECLRDLRACYDEALNHVWCGDCAANYGVDPLDEDDARNADRYRRAAQALRFRAEHETDIQRGTNMAPHQQRVAPRVIYVNLYDDNMPKAYEDAREATRHARMDAIRVAAKFVEVIE